MVTRVLDFCTVHTNMQYELQALHTHYLPPSDCTYIFIARLVVRVIGLEQTSWNSDLIDGCLDADAPVRKCVELSQVIERTNSETGRSSCQQRQHTSCVDEGLSSAGCLEPTLGAVHRFEQNVGTPM